MLLKNYIRTSIVVFVLVMVLLPATALAAPSQDGILRDTTSADHWLVKYLGGPNIAKGTPDENFDWAAQRKYKNGSLDTTGYSQPISFKTPDSLSWNSNVPWISPNNEGIAENGYYSYVTVVDDTAVAKDKVLDGLSISFISDDHLHAIVINGVLYSGFAPQAMDYIAWTQDYTNIVLNNVKWNTKKSNTIEFIVHNNATTSFDTKINPTGLSAKIQATYKNKPIDNNNDNNNNDNDSKKSRGYNESNKWNNKTNAPVVPLVPKSGF